MTYSPIFKLALGAVWTAGHRPTMTEKFDLQRACGYSVDFPAYLQGDGGRAQVVAALERAGYAAIPNTADILSLVQPLELPPRSPFVPQAGDQVRCVGSRWYDCETVHLQGMIGADRRGYTVANRVGLWHAGTNPERPAFVSLGNGGPSSIAYLDTRRLQATAETTRLRCWDFAFNPEAHAGVDFFLTVPIWTWTMPSDNEAHFLDWEEAEQPFAEMAAIGGN